LENGQGPLSFRPSSGGGLFALFRRRYNTSMAKWTFQSLIDGGMSVRAYCHDHRCNHNQVLDLEKLRDRFGPDAPAMHDDIAPKLRCARCGGKKVGLIYTPAGKSTWDNPYLKV
jgi:hypothetical protein